MLTVFESILPIFAIVMLGFALRKSNFVPADHWRVVEELCFWIFFPTLLAETLIKADLATIALGPYVFTLLAMLATMAVLTLLTWPFLDRFWRTKRGQFSTIFQTTTRWHGFIALAIVLKLYGGDGAALIAVAIAVMVPTLQVSNIFVLATFSSNARPPIGQILKTVLKNPLIWGVSIGLLVNLTGTVVWEPVMTMVDLLGRSALAMSLLALGAGLSLKAALRPSKELLVGLVGKLLLTPVVMAFWAVWFGVSGLSLSVLLVCASVPTAMNGYLLAKKMGGDADLYAATSTVQTVVSFFSIPLILWLGKSYFGAL
ncbi:AEC family transporter [Kiloniella laminariae]|uniref:AEC family transporter n=1 Tax=Kiloniella laminariae TaxID=454162 RepID=A0ABT4LH99_9PROT|nr:AEC family transporter [Kiloniella laminariae]MCZ4279372.1 AEC family transporter [Kiloniella laminariae]